MRVLEDSTLIFRKRKGTTNKGSDYENLIIAKLILLLINDATVKDFKIWSNDENFGLFDDVILEIDFVCGDIAKYAIQVKYSNDGRILTKSSLTEQRGNFSIEKYREGFKKSKICEYKTLLYTNRKFNLSDKLENGKTIKTDDFDLTIEQTEDSRLNSGRCFKFVSYPPDVFFHNFLLFTNQTDVDGIRKNIEDYFHQLFDCRDYSFKQYIDFITEWSNLEGKKVKLCKSWVQHKITLILLSEFIHPLITNGKKITHQMDLLRNIIMKCPTISFNNSAENVLVTLWSDLELELGNSTVSKLSRLYQVPIENSSILLWLMGRCPLIVTQNPVLLKTINLCPDLNFVILNDSEATKLSHLEGTLQNDVLTTFECSLQGKDSMSLKDLINGGQLLEHITTDDLLKMIDSVWCIGEKEVLPFPHISRSLTRHIFNWKVLDVINFGLGGEAFILITNYKEYKHMQYNTMNSENFYDVKDENWEFCNGKVIFVTEGEYNTGEFNEICDLNRGKREYHQFRQSGNYLEWVRSKGDITQYKKFVEESYLTESDLMRYQDDNKIDVICAGPGMGKTTLMKSIKNKTSRKFWTVLIYARNHCGYFKNKNTFIAHILSVTDNSIRGLVEILIRENRVEYIWDGLDEVSFENFCKILDLIIELSQTGMKQWITSRPNLKRPIETRFSVLSRTLIEFSELDQQRYIKQRLQCSEDNLHDIVHKIKRNIQLFPTNDILGIPLQIYLLTELLHRDQVSYENLLEKVFSVADLYEHFVDEKFNIYCTEKENIACGNDLFHERNAIFKQQQIELYEQVAVKIFGFVDTEAVKLVINGDRIGILDVRENNETEFIHTSFLEYFAACFLAKNRDVVVTLSDFLSDEKFNNVRFFFDLLLAKNCPAHIAVIYKNVELLVNCTKEEITCLDHGGRNLLHLLCAWGEKLESVNAQKTLKGYRVTHAPSFSRNEISWYTAFLTTLLTVCDPMTPDDLYKFTALDYAYKARCLGLYMKLLPGEVNFDEFDDVERICCAILYCVVTDFAEVFNIVQNIPHIEISFFDDLGTLAVSENSINCVKYLASQYYDNIPDLTLSMCECGYSDSVKYFLNNYPQIDIKKMAMKAIETQHIHILHYLINNKCVDVNLYDDHWHGGTLLYISSKLGLVKSVRCLICNKANVNARNNAGRTPLHVSKTRYITRLLLDNNADVNLRDNLDNTPLHMAACQRNTNIVKSLLEHQSNVNYQNKRGQTALHLACHEGNFEIVKMLIQHGADVDCKSVDGNSPIHSACHSKKLDIFRLLVDGGAYINAVNKFGEKPIHLSSEEGCFDIVRLLVDRGSDVNSMTTYDETPLDMARDDNIAQFLKNNGAIANKKGE